MNDPLQRHLAGLKRQEGKNSAGGNDTFLITAMHQARLPNYRPLIIASIYD